MHDSTKHAMWLHSSAVCACVGDCSSGSRPVCGAAGPVCSQSCCLPQESLQGTHYCPQAIHAVLCHAVLCCAVPAVLCCAVLCCAVLCCAVLCILSCPQVVRAMVFWHYLLASIQIQTNMVISDPDHDCSCVRWSSSSAYYACLMLQT